MATCAQRRSRSAWKTCRRWGRRFCTLCRSGTARRGRRSRRRASTNGCGGTAGHARCASWQRRLSQRTPARPGGDRGKRPFRGAAGQVRKARQPGELSCRCRAEDARAAVVKRARGSRGGRALGLSRAALFCKPRRSRLSSAELRFAGQSQAGADRGMARRMPRRVRRATLCGRASRAPAVRVSAAVALPQVYRARQRRESTASRRRASRRRWPDLPPMPRRQGRGERLRWLPFGPGVRVRAEAAQAAEGVRAGRRRRPLRMLPGARQPTLQGERRRAVHYELRHGDGRDGTGLRWLPRRLAAMQ